MQHRRLLLLFFCCFFLEVGFSQTPVLIRVVRAEQHDTLGCNIVSEITSLVYKQVINGKVKLWDSREKEIQITGTTLVEIERSSKTSFTDQEIIYIYEYWTGSGKSLKSETSGFSFSSKSKTGEEVSFGYVDFRDIQDLIFGTTVKSNANGNFNTTLAYYLNGKNYYYHIIQYGGTVIENITKSEQIKSDLTGGTGHFSNTAASSVEIPQKIVSWLLDINDNSDSEKYINSRKFENAVQDYLSSNREIYYNLGGDKISTHINVKSKLSITRIQVKEIWKKIDEKIQYDPVSVIIFINDTALTEILYRDMVKMEVSIGVKSWVDFIREKQFFYVIKKINNQEVSHAQSYVYLKALQSYEWGKITEFVKFY